MTDEFEEEQFEEKPFLEHLDDLRMTLFKIIVTTVVGAAVCLALSKQIFAILKAPINRYAVIVPERAATPPPPKATSPTKPPRDQAQQESPSQSLQPKTIVVGPLGGLVMLARDLVIYSKEAISFLNRYANETESPPKRASDKRPPASSQSGTRGKKKRASPEDEKPSVRIIVTSPTEGFVTVIKTGFICGLGATLPLNIFFLAQFVFPALTRKEKKYVTPSFFIGGVLFVIGVLFGYLVTLPLAINIFAKLNAAYKFENYWKMSQYLGTVAKLLIANGVIFEMPLLLTILVRIGVVSVGTLQKKRRHALVIMLFVAAALSPPDPPTMFMLALPMVVMYEACIWASWLLMRKKKRREQEEEEHESYWEERKRIRSAEKVEPEEKEEKQPPTEAPPEHEDYGSSPEESPEDYYPQDESGLDEPPREDEPKQDDYDYPYEEYDEGYWREEEDSSGQPPEEGESPQGDIEPGDVPPDDEQEPETGEEKPEKRDD